MRLLVTGATGALGRSVVRRLFSQGHLVTAYVRPTSEVAPIHHYVQRTVVGSITDPIALVRAADSSDAILHLVAEESSWGRRRARIVRVNVDGTRVTAEAAKTAGVPLLLHVSSTAAVGYSPDGVPINETHSNNLMPMRLAYHESRRLAEEEANDVRRYGVRVVIANPATPVSPCTRRGSVGHALVRIAQGAVRGHATGGGCFVDLEDIADGIVAALERGRDGERYILGGENLRYGDLFARLAAAAGVPYRGRALRGPALRAYAALCEAGSALGGPEPALSSDEARAAPLLFWYTSAKARDELGYRPRPLDAALERLVAASRAEGLLRRRVAHATS